MGLRPTREIEAIKLKEVEFEEGGGTDKKRKEEAPSSQVAADVCCHNQV